MNVLCYSLLAGSHAPGISLSCVVLYLSFVDRPYNSVVFRVRSGSGIDPITQIRSVRSIQSVIDACFINVPQWMASGTRVSQHVANPTEREDDRCNSDVRKQ